MTTKKEIDRLVKKYDWRFEQMTHLFRVELELLVAIAQKEQMLEDEKLLIGRKL